MEKQYEWCVKVNQSRKVDFAINVKQYNFPENSVIHTVIGMKFLTNMSGLQFLKQVEYKSEVQIILVKLISNPKLRTISFQL